MDADTNQWLHDVSQPDYRERVNAALKTRKISKAEFARLCGCSASNMHAWLGRYSWQRFPKYIWRKAYDLLGVRYEQL